MERRAGHKQHARVLLSAAALLLFASVVTAVPASTKNFRAPGHLEEVRAEPNESAAKASEAGWTGVITSIVGGAVAGVAALLLSYANRFREFDQSVHDLRLRAYPKLVKATAPLALYFNSTHTLTKVEIDRIGKGMSEWYFNTGGLLLSSKSRDAYFLLTRALTRAPEGISLGAPVFPRDADKIDDKQVREYRKRLGLPGDPTAWTDAQWDKIVEDWKFGGQGGTSNARKFGDFVLFQSLSSRLRTALAEDLRGRIAPDGGPRQNGDL